jgi:hypothetical protein
MERFAVESGYVVSVWHETMGDKMGVKSRERGPVDRPFPQLYTCMADSKEHVCSIVTDFGGAERAERKLREDRGWSWIMARQVMAQELCYSRARKAQA